jgi:hypothetical protein
MVMIVIRKGEGEKGSKLEEERSKLRATADRFIFNNSHQSTAASTRRTETKNRNLGTRNQDLRLEAAIAVKRNTDQDQP